MIYHEAVELTPTGHSTLPLSLHNHATSLVPRFARYGEDLDLQQAIMNYQQAIELTPDGHSDLPKWLNNLALSLESRFARYGEEADLNRAISVTHYSLKIHGRNLL
jgi:hypothetical protein